MSYFNKNWFTTAYCDIFKRFFVIDETFNKLYDKYKTNYHIFIKNILTILNIDEKYLYNFLVYEKKCINCKILYPTLNENFKFNIYKYHLDEDITYDLCNKCIIQYTKCNNCSARNSKYYYLKLNTSYSVCKFCYIIDMKYSNGIYIT
jgi:hypothetical protein